MFPVDDDKQIYIGKLAFADVRKTIIERFQKVVVNTQDVFVNASGVMKKSSSISTTLMKAICYSKGWIEEVSVQKGEQYSARILVIKSPGEDPS